MSELKTKCEVRLTAKLTADPKELTTKTGRQMVTCNAVGPGSQDSPWWIKLLSMSSQPLEAFAALHKGDFVTVVGEMRMGKGYTNRDGVVVAGQCEVWIDEVIGLAGDAPVTATEVDQPFDDVSIPF